MWDGGPGGGAGSEIGAPRAYGAVRAAGVAGRGGAQIGAPRAYGGGQDAGGA